MPWSEPLLTSAQGKPSNLLRAAVKQYSCPHQHECHGQQAVDVQGGDAGAGGYHGRVGDRQDGVRIVKGICVQVAEIYRVPIMTLPVPIDVAGNVGLQVFLPPLSSQKKSPATIVYEPGTE